MTWYYYFFVALLMSDYQIERRQLARAIDVALYKRNKNKATSLRIRSRATRTGCQATFSSIHYQIGRVLSRNSSKLLDSQVAAAAVASREDTIDTFTLNPCSPFSSRISRHVLMPRFICGISYPGCRQESNNYIWR